MTGALASYLRKLLALQTIGVLIALTALLQVLDLLDATTDILNRHLGLAGIVHYTLLRTPVELALSLPLAMLVGALFTYYTLARNHELIAIQGVGHAYGLDDQSATTGCGGVLAAAVAGVRPGNAGRRGRHERLVEFDHAARRWTTTTLRRRCGAIPMTAWSRSNMSAPMVVI